MAISQRRRSLNARCSVFSIWPPARYFLCDYKYTYLNTNVYWARVRHFFFPINKRTVLFSVYDCTENNDLILITIVAETPTLDLHVLTAVYFLCVCRGKLFFLVLFRFYYIILVLSVCYLCFHLKIWSPTMVEVHGVQVVQRPQSDPQLMSAGKIDLNNLLNSDAFVWMSSFV